MFSLRRRARTGLHLAVVVVLLAAAAWGQASSSAEQEFAAYHERLSGAADGLLTAPVPGANGPVAKNVVPALRPTSSDGFSIALIRVQQLRPLLERILREEGVPTDMAAVVLVESGGRPMALSPKGALGLWQLMPETARRYGLSVSPALDERTDIPKSTRVAARYLHDLYAEFGDWKLALAAYNAGEQAVRRALNRSANPDFLRASVLLPAETRAYVPAVMAALPLFGRSPITTGPRFRAAQAANVVYATTRLEVDSGS